MIFDATECGYSHFVVAPAGGLCASPPRTLDPEPGTSDGLHRMSVTMNSWLKEQGMRPVRRALTTKNIKAQGTDTFEYPELSSVFKAIHIKHMIYYLAHRYAEGAATPIEKVRSVCVWSLADFLHKVDVGPQHLSHSERRLPPYDVHACKGIEDPFLSKDCSRHVKVFLIDKASC